MPSGKDGSYAEEYATAVANGDTRRVKMCLKKNTYHSEAEAESVAQHQMFALGIYLRVYQCDYCGEYHLTHKRAYRYTEDLLAA